MNFVVVQLLGRVRLFSTPWTAARQAPLSSLCISKSPTSLLKTKVHSLLQIYYTKISQEKKLFLKISKGNFDKHTSLRTTCLKLSKGKELPSFCKMPFVFTLFIYDILL